MRKTTKSIRTEDREVSVTITDRNSEVVWVFLHGWGGQKEVWRQITEQLEQSTVSIDLPGFGASDDLHEPWTVQDYSRAVTGVIDKLSLKSVVLVGHSFGGQIAVNIAADQPGWLTGLVLVSAAAVRSEQPKTLSAIGSVLSPLFQLPVLRRLRPALYHLIGADVPPKNDNLKRTMRNILREDQTDKLSSVSAPTQILWGDQDTAAPTSQSDTLHKQIPDASVTILEGGHFIFIDQPEVFVKELQLFNDTRL